MNLDVAKRDLLLAHNVLASSVMRFASQIGKPLYAEEDGHPRFQFLQKDAKTIELLMAVRIVSGLNASQTLLDCGFINEIGVLLRTIYDFLLTISFLEDGLNAPKQTEHFKRFVEQYFSERIRSWQDFLKQQPYLPFRKKRAAEAREMAPAADPARVTKMLEAEEKCLSGYVHGHYGAVMELYRGATKPQGEGFLVKGVPEDCPHIVTWFGQIAMYTYRSLLLFIYVAKRLGLADVAQELWREARRFEKSEAYAVHCPGCGKEMSATEKVIKDEKTGEVKERWTRYQCTNPRCCYRIG